MEKRLYYFTFGEYADDESFCKCVQPILASDWTSARKKMLEVHGSKWDRQYSEKDWEKLRHDRQYELSKIGVLMLEDKELPVLEGV